MKVTSQANYYRSLIGIIPNERQIREIREFKRLEEQFEQFEKIDEMVALQELCNYFHGTHHAPQQAAPATAPERQAAPGGVVTDKAGPGWSLKSIQRVPGYRWPLYQFLKAAHTARQPCPKAQHVLDAWKLMPPNGLTVIELPRRDELEYELETGKKKRAAVKHIQAVIKGLLSE